MKVSPLKSIILLSLLTLFINGPVQAENITLNVPHSNLKADAEYVAGDADKSAVLILHGFLTTNRFHTVISMARALQDEGYTTLAPTLTLNISKRQKAIKCNAIHTHSLEDDIIEIKAWIKWLHNKGYQKVTLLGHSSGSQELLATLLTDTEDLNINGAIFTSLFYLNGEELGISKQDIESATQAVSKGLTRPSKYSFLFCKNNYYSTPNSFLSYLKLDRQYVTEALDKLTIPSYTIMGSADQRYQSVGQNWLEVLEKSKTHLIMVEGANHFFSSEHEFDLQDHIIDIVNTL
ncbi:MAG: alpha/beta hydrolase [Gammaproteobacteria bacterium]|nr:alpha/beta hydrolase [Gammaproteobacteria bacterium]